MNQAYVLANPTLQQLQAYYAVVCKERGFDDETLVEAFILFSEEVGELAHVVWNKDKNSKRTWA